MRYNAMAASFASAASLIALAAPAYAQTTSDAVSPGSATASPEVGLTDIVVTAQRKSESAQRAAVAIAVVSGRALADRNATSPSDITRLVPAVAIQSAGGSASTFFVRGVGNFAVNGYTDPAIAFNYDGVYIGRGTSTGGVLYDLERVEVLKGPQGTLYGRNATSGAINVLPARPVAGRNEAALSASYGNYNALQLQGSINLAMGNDGALRVSAMHSQHDGYLSDGTSDQDKTAVRVQMLAKLTDTLTLRVSGDYSHDGGMGQGSSYAYGYAYNAAAGQYVFTPSGLSNSTGLFDPASQAYRQTRFIALSGRNAAPLDRAPYLNNDFYGVNAEVVWNSPIGTLTVLPAYRSAKLDQIFTIPAFTAYLQEKQEQTSLEVRLNGDRLGGFLDYVLGAYYYRENVDGNYTFNQQGSSSFQNFNSKVDAKAAFARLTAHLADRLRLVGGIRYTDEVKSFNGTADVFQVACTRRVAGVTSCPTAPLFPTVDDQSQVGFAVPTTPGTSLAIGTTGANATYQQTIVNTSLPTKKVNFRAAVEFDLAPHSLLYASFENGFRSGGFSLSLGHETFNPEYIDAYTIGIKNRLFGNKLQLNVEAFLWKYRNQQVTHAGLDSRGIQSQFTENVGASTNKGFEVEAQYRMLRDTLLSANAQYLNATYDSFVYQVPVGNAPPVSACPYSPGTTGYYAVNCSGMPAFQSPKWTFNFGVQQTFHFGDTEVTLQADTQYRSSRFAGFEYLSFENIGANWQTGAQLSVKPARMPFTLALYVQNIENNRVPVGVNQWALGSVFTNNVSPPRTYGFRISGKF